MIQTRATLVVIMIGASYVLAGCASSRSNLPVYDPQQVGTVLRTEKGEVVAVRDVLIKPLPASGGSTGGVVGGAVGRSAATGNPGSIAGAVGAVIGSAIGSKSDERPAEEITIVMEGGHTIVIVQERNGEPPLAPGEKVSVVTSAPTYPTRIGRTGIGLGGASGTARVMRDERFVGGLFR
jgi:outer membrane lipoprotein SlyB